MRIVRRDFLKLMGSGGVAATLPLDLSFAAGYPTRPITQVVSTALGGGVDTVARAVSAADENQSRRRDDQFGQQDRRHHLDRHQVRVRPAGSDGYTWLACPGFDRGLRILNLDTTVTYKDWQYFGCDTSYMSIAVLPDSPIKSLADLLEQGRKEPGKLRMATNGPGGTWYLAALLVQRASKAKYHARCPTTAASRR